MRIIIAKDYDDASRRAASFIAAQILAEPKSVLGLATGSTPIGTYKELIKWYEEGYISFEDVSTINLDEYFGLAKTDDQSYYHFMQENLHKHVDIKEENIHLPNGLAKDVQGEIDRYNGVIDGLGGIDLQLLGIGTNGHVGFNEPAETIEEGVYLADLTQSTIDSNKRFFEKEEDVPRKAFTVGVGPIMRAKKNLMVATGANKAAIMKEALFGPITPQVPASLLRLHPNVVYILDEEAAAEIKDLV